MYQSEAFRKQENIQERVTEMSLMKILFSSLRESTREGTDTVTTIVPE